MNSVYLWFIDRLKPLIVVLGADFNQLRAIVAVKLMMDNRRSYTSLGRYGQKANNEPNNAFLQVLGVYIVFGLFMSLLFLAAPPKPALFVPLTLQFGYVMAVCAMTLLSDFSTLILDSAYNQIVLPRPVNGRTLLLARVMHIACYLFSIALALSLVGILVISVRFGALAAVTFLLMSLLSSILMVFLTNVFYLLLMQFMSEERLREVINYFQIVMAILFYSGYQLLPRLMNQSDIMNAEPMTIVWWHYLVPPMWMAGAIDMFIQLAFDGPHLALLGLALVMPFAGLYLMNRVLAPVFNQRLAGLEQDSRPETIDSKPTETVPKSGLVDQLSGWLTNNPLERAGFAFAWRVTARDRKFKLKTYPQLGFGLAFIIAMSVGKRNLGANSEFYLFALYYAGLFVMTAQYQLSASDDYKASWVYGSAPIAQPGELLSGATKAIITKLLLPYFALVAAYVLFRYGTDTFDDIILAFFNSLVMALLSALSTNRHLPFSIPQDAINRSTTSRSLIVLFLLGLIGVAHFGLTLVPFGVWIAIPISALIVWFLLQRYRQTSWSQIAES